MSRDEFLDRYASKETRHNMGLDLDRLIEQLTDQMAASEIMKPSEVSADLYEGCKVLEIGEGGEGGFYVVTDDAEKAEKAANAYLKSMIGETLAEHYGADYGSEKVSLHVYTKPWLEDDYSEWYWYKTGSTHEKAEWVYRFEP